jgi:hypothetical protein
MFRSLFLAVFPAITVVHMSFPGHVVGTGMLQAQSAPATSSSDSLRIRKTFFGGLKYAVGSGKEQRAIEPVFGFTLNRPFRETLATRPEALAAAEKANSYLVLGAVGGLGLVAASIMFTLENLSSTSDQLEGRSSEASYEGAIIVGVASLVATIAGQSLARSHINRAVGIYNRAGVTAGPTSASACAPRLRAQSATGRHLIGVSVTLR